MAKNPSAFIPQRSVAVFPGGDRKNASAHTPMVQLGLGRKHFDQGVAHANGGRWKQALKDFEKAVLHAPDQKTYYYCYGVALTHAGRFGEAIKVFHRELAINPDHPSTLTEIGTCFGRIGRSKEAIQYLERGLARWPNMPHAQFSLGLSLLIEKRNKEAILVFSRVLALDSAYVGAYRQRAFAYVLEGQQQKAIDDMNAAIALGKKDHQTLLSLGVYKEKQSQDFDAGALLLAAATVAEDAALPQAVYALYLINRRMCEQGLAYVDKALALDPMVAEGHVAQGYGFLGQGKISQAVEAYRRAGELKPDDASIAGSLLFALQHNFGVDESQLYEAHTKWASLYKRQDGRDRLDFENDADPDRKLRIGFVSADLRAHAVTFLVIRAVEQLAQLGHEIFCYKTDDKCRDDRYSDRYKAISKVWRDISHITDDECQALFAEHQIDVLIDLSGHTTGNRLSLFSKRSAPLQLTWAGYVGTTGLDSYDGLIADPVEVPAGHDGYYTEPVVRLPDCYVCFDPPARAPDVTPLPCLETDSFTFGCFNRPAKINEEVARAWARILERVPNSRIVMVYGSFKEQGTRDSMYKIFESGGVPKDRVELLGEGDQMKLLLAYGKVDLALDPFPYSGGVTTLEAIWMGVPVVTLAGNTFAGRHSASHLTAAGLGSFCTYSVDDYIDLAVSWSQRRDELALLRSGLRNHVAESPLNDQIRFGDNLDRALKNLWRDWCSQSLEKRANTTESHTQAVE